MPYPGCEIPANPASRGNRGQGFTTRFQLQEFGEGHSPQLLVIRQSSIEQAKKWGPVSRVMFPRVLAVQDYRHDIVMTIVGQGVVDSAQSIQEIGCSILGVPFGVGKSDQIGQAVVTEKEARALDAVSPLVRAELLGKSELMSGESILPQRVK